MIIFMIATGIVIYLWLAVEGVERAEEIKIKCWHCLEPILFKTDEVERKKKLHRNGKRGEFFCTFICKDCGEKNKVIMKRHWLLTWRYWYSKETKNNKV